MRLMFVGAIDQGTTSTRFMVFDANGREVARRQLEHEQILPRPGWVEHDAIEIAARVDEVIVGALRTAGMSGRDLAAVGITNQRETTVVWDRRTGRPWHNAIVWQDTRTDRDVQALGSHRQVLCDRTGLPPATYFSSTKLRWILDHVDGVRQAAERGDALFGTIDTWVIWNLTGGAGGGLHVTDVTNASRTQLMDLRTLEWDDRLLSLFEIPRAMLPRIQPSASTSGFGTTRANGPVGTEVPIAGWSPSFHPSVVSSPLLLGTISVPVLSSMKLPVPYVFFASPTSYAAWPNVAAC
jgi:glycerol kinase